MAIVKIGYLTDIHHGAVDDGTVKCTEAVSRVEKAMEQFTLDGVDTILHGGDLIDLHTDFDDIATIIAAFDGETVHHALGNRDIEDGAGAGPTYNEFLAAIGQASEYYSAQVGASHVHVVVLDGNLSAGGVRYEDGGGGNSLAATQRTWLAAELTAIEAADANALIIILCHFGWATAAQLTDRADLLTILQAHNVVGLLQGHNHLSFRHVGAAGDGGALDLGQNANGDDIFCISCDGFSDGDYGGYITLYVNDADGTWSIRGYGTEVGRAARTLYKPAGAGNFSDNWAAASGGAATEAPPAEDEHCACILDANSGNLTMTAKPATIGSFVATGFAGTIDGGGFGIDIAGDLTIPSGCNWSSPGEIKLVGSGNLQQKDSTPRAHQFYVGSSPGVFTNNADKIYCAKWKVGKGGVKGSGMVYVYPTADDFIDCDEDGWYSVKYMAVYLGATNRSNAGAIIHGNLTINANDGIILTQTGLLKTGVGLAGHEVLTILGQVINATAVLVLTDNLDTGDSEVLLGHAATASRTGDIRYGGGSHKIGGMKSNNAAAVNNVARFEHSFIDNKGTILGIQGVNEITVTSDGARIRGGTITGVNCTGHLWCQPQTVTDGTGNSSDVIFRPKPEGIGMGALA